MKKIMILLFMLISVSAYGQLDSMRRESEIVRAVKTTFGNVEMDWFKDDDVFVMSLSATVGLMPTNSIRIKLGTTYDEIMNSLDNLYSIFNLPFTESILIKEYYSGVDLRLENFGNRISVQRVDGGGLGYYGKSHIKKMKKFTDKNLKN